MNFHRSALSKPRGVAYPGFRPRAVRALFRWIALLSVLATHPAAGQQAAAAGSLVLDDVTVVDVEHGTLLPKQRVVIAGNRIQSVNVGGKNVPPPAGAKLVDAAGKYLIPGLWDMHAHPGVPEGDLRRVHTPPTAPTADLLYLLFLANGVTGFRDAWSLVPLDTLRQWRREILAGARVGPPRQILSGAAIDAENPCIRPTLTGHICVSSSDSTDPRRLVESLKAAGADMIKTYRLTRETYLAIAAEARRVGLPFGGHLNAGNLTAMEASDSGAVTIEHIQSTGGLAALCLEPPATVERCRPVAEHFRRNGTWWVPTWIFPPYGSYAARPRAQQVLERFATYAREFWADSVRSDGARNYLRADAGAKAAEPPASTSILDSLGYMYVVRQAGLPTVAGTDAGAPLMEMPLGFSLHAELALYAAEGMTPLEALRTATLNPAKLLHGTDSLGTVAPGKLADLVLLDANPLEDITNTTTIRAVIANGRYFDRANLDDLLARVRRAFVGVGGIARSDLIGSWAGEKNQGDMLRLKADSTWTEGDVGTTDTQKPRHWNVAGTMLHLAGEGSYRITLQDGGQQLVLRREYDTTGAEAYTYKRTRTP